jgi:hypothetical protein
VFFKGKYINTAISIADESLKGALKQLNSILIEGETLEAWAVQRRIFSILRRRTLIAASSGRFIAIRRGLFGGFQMSDLRWQDISDAKINVGIIGADIFLSSSASSDLAVSRSTGQYWNFRGFRKEQCQQVYRLAQAHEQAWREKRRVRELEELRAKSGGIQLGSTYPSPSHVEGAPVIKDAVTRLKEAKQLLDNSLISDSEYEALKARIIENI